VEERGESIRLVTLMAQAIVSPGSRWLWWHKALRVPLLAAGVPTG